MREQFERWISAPPYEYSIETKSEKFHPPGIYRSVATAIAWEAWQEARKAEFICNRCSIRKNSEYPHTHEF